MTPFWGTSPNLQQKEACCCSFRRWKSRVEERIKPGEPFPSEQTVRHGNQCSWYSYQNGLFANHHICCASGCVTLLPHHWLSTRASRRAQHPSFTRPKLKGRSPLHDSLLRLRSKSQSVLDCRYVLFILFIFYLSVSQLESTLVFRKWIQALFNISLRRKRNLFFLLAFISSASFKSYLHWPEW